MKKIVLIAIALATSACAHIDMVKAPASSLQAAQGKPLTTVLYKKSDFSAMTAGKVAAGSLFGAIGGAIAGSSMASAGNNIIEQNNVPDPATAIAAQLGPAYASYLHAASTRQTSDRDIKGDDPKALAHEAADDNGVIFDVKTINWMFSYFPSSWQHYRVTYVARARLIDAGTGAVVGQVPCTYVSDNADTAATYDELVAEQAALLKKKLAAASVACSGIIAKNMFADGEVAISGTPAIGTTQQPASVAQVTAPPVVVALTAQAPTPAQAPLAQSVAPVFAAGMQVHVRPGSAALSRPVAGAPVIASVPDGASLQLVARASNDGGNWWYASGGGTTGWLPESALTP